MHPSFLLAQLHAESSLDRFAHSALPDAPVRPHTPRRRQFGWPAPVRLRRTDEASPVLVVSHPTAC
jgi:hypothetical protein